MALVLKRRIRDVINEDKAYIDEITQDYIDGTDGGWGQLTNPNRSERALLFFAEYIDEDDSASYLEQELNLIGSNVNLALKDGTGLSNTDISTFKIESAADGQHNLYFAVLERDNTKVGGTAGDMYFNIDDSLPYYYNGSSWLEITDSLLDTIKVLSSVTVFNDLFKGRRRKTLIEATRDLYSVANGYDEDLRQQRDDYSARLFNAQNAFNEGNESSARVLIDGLKRFRFTN